MKRTTKRLIALAALTGIGVTAVAAVATARGRGDPGPRFERTSHGGPFRGGPFASVFTAYDGNGDGTLSQEELDSGRRAHHQKFDGDGDGALSLQEYQALWLDAMRERMVDQFQAHDDDGDGKVTAQEFGDRFSNFVARVDHNENGVLDHGDFQRPDGRGDGQRR